MTQYQLPRTDDGEVNWEYLSLAIEDAFCSGDEKSIKWAREALRGMDANARAEEREACLEETNWCCRGNESGNYQDGWEACKVFIAKAIRARGDKT